MATIKRFTLSRQGAHRGSVGPTEASRLRRGQITMVHLYEHIVEHSDQGIWLADADHSIVDANPKMVKMLGYALAEMKGKTIWGFMDEEGQKSMREIVPGRAEGEYEQHDLRLLHKSGESVCVLAFVSSLYDVEDRFSGSLVMVTDTTEKKISEAEQARLAAIVETSQTAIIDKNLDGVVTSWNRAAEDLYGWTAAEMIGYSLECIFPEELRGAEFREVLSQLRRGNQVILHETKRVRKDGVLVAVSMTASPVRDQDGQICGGSIVTRDITQQKEVEEQLANESRRVIHVLESVTDAFISLDLEWRVTYTNKHIAHYFPGKSREEMRGHRIHEVIPNFEKTVLFRQFKRAMERREVRRFEANLTDPNVWFAVYAYPTQEGLAVYMTDISIRKRVEEAMRHQAYHDPLTGLPNRLHLSNRLGEELKRLKSRKGGLAVLFLDLDQFKYINDTLGHQVGDQLLVEVAERLRGCIKRDDIVARFGGDEFVIVVTDVLARDDVERVARRILLAFRPIFGLEGWEVHMNTSIGIALSPEHGQDTDALFKQADTALYKAKEQGCNTFYFYDVSMKEQADDRWQLEQDLRKAIENHEFEVHYQPIFDVGTEQIVAAEALLRWVHPRAGMVLPGQFIPLAEETGMILPIGDFVIQAVCRQLNRWQTIGGFNLQVGVNLSVRQLVQAGLPERVQEVLSRYQVRPEQLEFEVTESVAFDSLTRKNLLDRLREIGVRIGIDDFGTGHSALGYLKQLVVHTIKIDRTFVAQCTTDERDKAILRAIIDIAHTLHLMVVAEGVEDEEQFLLLKSQGCDLMQGYYLCQALPAEEFQAFWQKNRELVQLL